VQVIDISDPTNPIGVGQVSSGLTSLWDIQISANYAYVADFAGNAFHIIDISDPANPVIVSTIADNTNGADYLGNANYIAIVGNYAFVTSNSEDAVQIIDISSSTNPTGVGSIVDGERGAVELNGARGIEISGGYVYVAGLSDNGLQILSLPGLITPTAKIGNLVSSDIQSDYLRVTNALTTDGSLNVGTNALIGGALTITGTASSSLQSGNTNPALTITSGYVGIGTTTPYADLSVAGDISLTGGLYDSTASLGTSGMVMQTDGTNVTWVATSSLGIANEDFFTDGGDITYLTSLTDVLSIGTTTDIATSTGLAVYNRDIEILPGGPTQMWECGRNSCRKRSLQSKI